MVTRTISIKNEIAAEFVETVNALHSCPTITVINEDGNEVEEKEFTLQEWAFKYYINLMKRELNLYRKRKAEALVVDSADDDIS